MDPRRARPHRVSDPNGIDTFAGGMDTFASGINTFAAAMDTFAKGIHPFAVGIDPLAKGIHPFGRAMDTFGAGIHTVAVAMDNFTKGIHTFGMAMEQKDPADSLMTTWNQFIWNSGAPWEPAIAASAFLIHKKQRHKTMRRQTYYPQRSEAQPEWLDNFAEKLLTYAATLGVSNARRDVAVADALWLSYVIGTWAPAARAWADSLTDVVTAAASGTGSSAMTLPTFTAPPLPPAMAPLPATVPVAPGALDRIFKLVKDLKNATGMTDAIASDLRVVGSAEDPSVNPIPKFTPKVEQGPTCQCVRIRFSKYGRTGVYIESRRNGGAWEFLASPVRSPYVDNRPLLAAGAPEIREYRMRYWDKGVPTGDWTDVAKVTVAP